MNDHKITRREADALVELVRAAAHGVRTSEWQRAGIVGAIREVLDQRGHVTLAELAYVAVTVAKDPAYRKPVAIAFDGPHWSLPKKGSAHVAQVCVRCGGAHTAQSECLPPEDERVDGGEGRTDALRDALAAVRSNLCRHGVPYTSCTREHGEAADA